MAIEPDGFAVLRAIATHETLFGAARPDIGKFVKSVVLQRLKDKGTALAQLREICAAVGPDNFALILDDASAPLYKSILTRLDKHRSELKAADSERLRSHLLSLAKGTVEPALADKATSRKAPKAAPESKAPAAEAPQRLGFRSAGAKRKR